MNWTLLRPESARPISLPMYFMQAVLPVPVFPNSSTFEGLCPSRAVTSMRASSRICSSLCGRTSGIYEGLKTSLSPLKRVLDLMYCWNMVSCIAPPRRSKKAPSLPAVSCGSRSRNPLETEGRDQYSRCYLSVNFIERNHFSRSADISWIHLSQHLVG